MRSLKNLIFVSLMVGTVSACFFGPLARSVKRAEAAPGDKTFSYPGQVLEKYAARGGSQVLVDCSIERGSHQLFTTFRITFDKDSGKALKAQWMDKAGHEMALPAGGLWLRDIPDAKGRILATFDSDSYPTPPDRIGLVSIVSQ